MIDKITRSVMEIVSKIKRCKIWLMSIKLMFILFSFAVTLQILSFHPSSAVPASPVYLRCSKPFSKSCSLC